MAASHCLSLASGVMPEATPVQTARAAADAGFDAVGLWVEVAQWTADTTREVRAIVQDAGMRVLDAEVIWIKPGEANPDHLRLIDIAAELKAENVLVVSSDSDLGATAAKFAQLCEHAAPTGIRVALEFGAFTDIPNLATALGILRQVNHPSQALLIDPLHLHRSGGRPADLAQVPAPWFNYAQMCDATLVGPDIRDRAAVREEAVDFRLIPGDGELPLAELRAALPAGIPLSLEIRSKSLRAGLPDFTERARAVMIGTRRWLKGLGLDA